MPTQKLPRGIRQNNPGNIRHGDKWQGLAKEQTDPAFCTFTDPVWGVRAICCILIAYEKKGFNTVAAMISRWAPPTENNTAAYIRAVAADVGVDAGQEIDVDTTAVMLPMVKAIIAHENGSNPYPDSIIREAIRRAGVSDAPKPSLLKKVGAPAAATASIGLSMAAQLAEPAKHAADSLAPMVGAPLIQKAVTVLLTIAGLATLAMFAKGWLDHKRGL